MEYLRNFLNIGTIVRSWCDTRALIDNEDLTPERVVVNDSSPPHLLLPAATSTLSAPPRPPPAVLECCQDCSCRDHNDQIQRKITKMETQINNLQRMSDASNNDIFNLLEFSQRVVHLPSLVTSYEARLATRNVTNANNNNEASTPVLPNTDYTERPTNNSIAEVYNMNHKNRGMCYVFIHETFAPELKLDERICANAEETIIKEIFGEHLGFDVRIHKDEKYSSVKKKLKQLKTNDYSNDDCVCFIIATHGEDNGLIYAYDAAYKVSIFEDYFSKVKSLVNKPKFIFIQTCRGYTIDKGLTNCETYDETDHTVSCDETDHVSKNKVPRRADFFIANSTSAGYLSFQQWFIPTLCMTLKNYSETKSIDSIFNITKYEVAKKERGKNKGKQIPSVRTTLRGDVYLKKKLRST